MLNAIYLIYYFIALLGTISIMCLISINEHPAEAAILGGTFLVISALALAIWSRD